MKKTKGEKRKKKHDRIILVEDLAPRRNVTGGSGKLLFGERAGSGSTSEPPPKRGA